MAVKRVGIVGYGAVGRGVHTLFPDAAIYDEPLGMGDRASINECDIAFVAVPTPRAADGACDLSIVESVVTWIEADIIVLRSTVPPGSTDELRRSTGKRVIFQPEYGPGETPDHPFADVRDIRWIVLGGPREDTIPVVDAYKRTFNADIRIHQTDARTAELTKYMENCFLALKVTFCNEFYDIAEHMGVDYNELRELWLLDPRIGRSHSFVMPDSRGFGGKCLPKDMDAMITAARAVGYDPVLLASTMEANDRMRNGGNGQERAGERTLVTANGSAHRANGRSHRP